MAEANPLPRAPKKRRFDLNVAVLGTGPEFMDPRKFANVSLC